MRRESGGLHARLSNWLTKLVEEDELELYIAGLLLELHPQTLGTVEDSRPDDGALVDRDYLDDLKEATSALIGIKAQAAQTVNGLTRVDGNLADWNAGTE